MSSEQRPGEIALAADPAAAAPDAHLVFIGRIRSPWATRADCPHNLTEARQRLAASPAVCSVELAPGLAAGLDGLSPGSRIILLYWMNEARRDLIVQAPRHAPKPRGVFSLRSPVRPNPIALAAVTITAIDAAQCRIEIDAIDCRDGTPLLDIKPWIASVDGPAPVSA